MKRRGGSLLEVVLAVGLLSLTIPLLLNLIPTGLNSLRHADQLTVATSLASYRVDQAARLPPDTPLALREQIQVGRVTYTLVRAAYAVDPELTDVDVAVWADGMHPVTLTTRLYRGSH